MANDTKIVCRNVFKTKEKAAFTKEYTRKWIELINEFERNKGITVQPRTLQRSAKSVKRGELCRE